MHITALCINIIACLTYDADIPTFSLQARFAKHVFPGETLRTEMWRDGPSKVIFQTRVVERDVIALSFAAVEFNPDATIATSRL